VRYFEEVLKRIQVPAVYYGLGMAYAQSGKRAQVLDTVTHLRNVGEAQMAAQLEGMIRSNQPVAPPPPPTALGLPERQAGTLVPATPPAPAEPSASEGQTGTMRVRLRGQLNTPEVTASGQNPASSSGERSAIERIREMQRRRMGAIPQSSGY
jgi:hypothetical protein